MRRAIADSDDEEDDDLVLAEPNRHAGDMLPGCGGNDEVEGAIESQDGTIEKSTGSTGERLEHQH